MRLTSGALRLSVVIVGFPITANAQSADKVIERHIDAIGGKKAVEKIVSTDVSGTISSGDGRSGVFIQRTSRPHLYSMSVAWGDSRWRTGFNGRSAWQEDSVDGLRTLYGQAASRVRAEASYANSHFLLPEKLNQVFVAGPDQVRNRAVIVVVALTPDGVKRTLFFDASSHLLVKDLQQTAAGMEERFFDDYRLVDQVLEPHRIEWHRNGETFQIAVERVTHNTPLDAQVFDVPAPTERTLNINAVLSAAERSEQRAESLLTSYAYSMTSSSGRFEQGQVAEREGSTFEFFHLGGRPVARLVKKEGGQALSEAERRLEDERVNKIVREYERQRPSGQPVRREQGGRASGLIIFRTPLMSPDWLPALLRMSAFSNVRRERVRGRPALVVEFQPKPGSAPKSEIERQAETMAGTLWIDEASQHLIRAESYFCDDYNRAVQGSSLWIERTLVNDEVWLPSRHEVRFRLSFFFGALAQFAITVQFADYKKFNVDTDSTIALPDAGR